jgi:hypothetical protein
MNSKHHADDSKVFKCWDENADTYKLQGCIHHYTFASKPEELQGKS